MTGDAASERAIAGVFEYYRQLEMVVAMLVAAWGEPHEGGYRVVIPADQAWLMRQRIGSTEPVVISQFQSDRQQYVIDVL